MVQRNSHQPFLRAIAVGGGTTDDGGMGRVLVLLMVTICVAACEVEDDSSERQIPKERAQSDFVDPGLIEDCVEYTQLAAFLGNEDYIPLWNDAGQDTEVLREHCGALGAETLAQISDEREATEAFLEAATAEQPPVVQPTPQAPQPLADLGSPGCHPSYSGACVPIASDVDCAGGTGNGPEYVAGPLVVPGEDPYGLDDDGDGIACEPKP